MKIVMFWNALRAGETLTDPKLWKNRQDTVNAATAVIYGLLWLAQKYWADLTVSGTDVTEIAQGVAVVLGVIANIYLTTATTTTKGFASKQERVEGD